MSSRDLSKFDYVQTNKSVAPEKDEDRLSGINVSAFGSAAKILKQVAAKVRRSVLTNEDLTSMR